METKFSGNTPIIERPLIEIDQNATLVITESFLNQIKYICNEISAVEWSGIIYYKTKGEPKKLASFEVEPYYIHLMDKGSSAYTEFDSDDSLTDLYNEMPELDPFEDTIYKHGKIHSHNTMDVFHSGTDMQDLQDQATVFDEYYLSVIVNNFLDIEAKMAFVANIPPQNIKPMGFTGAKWQLPKKEVLVTVDFDIESPVSNVTIPQLLKDRTEEVIEKAEIKPAVNGRYLQPHQELSYDYPKDFDTGDYRIKQGKIALRDFFHTSLAEETGVGLTEVFEIVSVLTPKSLSELQDELNPWFEKLSPWSKQNVILYITDENSSDTDGNLDFLYEGLFQLLRTVEQ